MVRGTLIAFGVGLLLLSLFLTLVRQGKTSTAYFIAFTSSRDNRLDIYRMNPDGSQQEVIADSPYSDLSPEWSPDGRWIAFTSTRDADREIYLVSASGNAAKRLTYTAGDDFSPRWSPDGTWILFLSRRNGAQELYRVQVASGNIERLTQGGGDKLDPLWSPDGQWILFVNAQGETKNLYRVRANGRDLTALTTDSGSQTQAAWSPDGQWIVYVGFAGTDENLKYRNGQQQLYLMRADGSEHRPLVDTEGQDRNPLWSVDGKSVIFESGFIQKECPDEGDCDWSTLVFRYDLATDTLTQLVRLGGYLPQSVYRWSPDGAWIGFVRYRFESASSDIYRMKPDGSQIEPITTSNGEDWQPAWSPLVDMRWRGVGLAISGLAFLAAGGWRVYRHRENESPAPFPLSKRWKGAGRWKF